MIIKVNISDQDVKLAIANTISKLDNLMPVIRAISGIMLDAGMRAFSAERDPKTDEPWQDLSPAYKKQRAKEGSLGKILERSGMLKSSLQTRLTENSAIVGTNKTYAAVHQYGASITKQAGSLNLHFAKTRTGQTLFATAKKASYGMKVKHKAYTINIPARPFLGIGNDDMEEIEQSITRHILNSL